MYPTELSLYNSRLYRQEPASASIFGKPRHLRKASATSESSGTFGKLLKQVKHRASKEPSTQASKNQRPNCNRKSQFNRATIKAKGNRKPQFNRATIKAKGNRKLGPKRTFWAETHLLGRNAPFLYPKNNLKHLYLDLHLSCNYEWAI